MRNSVFIEAFRTVDADAWDEFLAAQSDGLDFLHTRRFLSHRETPLEDLSFLVRDRRGAVAGVFPAARDPEQSGVVISHPGLTYGGLIAGRRLRDGDMLDAMMAICDRLRNEGVRVLRYKPVPSIYRAQPRDDDLYAICRLAGRLVRCDLGAALNLSMPAKPQRRRLRAVKRAKMAGLEVERGAHLLEELWPLITHTLADRIGGRPTHTLAELQTIRNLFPKRFDIAIVRQRNTPIAGLVLFISRYVARLQYIVSSSEGYAHNAVDLAIDRCIDEEREKGRHYIDFGTSTLDAGQALSIGVQDFKAGFGAGSIVQQVWEIDLA